MKKLNESIIENTKTKLLNTFINIFKTVNVCVFDPKTKILHSGNDLEFSINGDSIQITIKY